MFYYRSIFYDRRAAGNAAHQNTSGVAGYFGKGCHDNNNAKVQSFHFDLLVQGRFVLDLDICVATF